MRPQIPFLLSCCFITASAIAEVPQTVDKHYAIQGRAELEAQIGSGSIHTRSCGGCRDIHVHLEMNGVDRSRYHLEEQQSGNHVRFVLKQDDNHGWNWTSHNGKSPELTVEVPQESSLELGTGSGDVTLRGVRGSVNMHTGSGDITIDETSGALSLRTGSGGLSGKDLSGTMKAQSGSGDIHLAGDFSQLDARTGSGTLDLSAGNLHDGATLTSGSGDVNLRLARDTHANVRATTGSGDIHSDLPITTQGDVGQRHTLDGTLNGGGAPIRVSTGSGSIRLQAL